VAKKKPKKSKEWVQPVPDEDTQWPWAMINRVATNEDKLLHRRRWMEYHAIGDLQFWPEIVGVGKKTEAWIMSAVTDGTLEDGAFTALCYIPKEDKIVLVKTDGESIRVIRKQK
jgi:hypothetical protein